MINRLFLGKPFNINPPDLPQADFFICTNKYKKGDSLLIKQLCDTESCSGS
jgi:hypothetical protein